MVTCVADIEGCVVVCSLSGGSQHRSDTAFQLADLFCDCIVRRVCESCIEISVLFQIEQTPHLLARLIFKGRALIDRENSRLPVLRLPAALDTDRCWFSLLSHNSSSLSPDCGPMCKLSIIIAHFLFRFNLPKSLRCQHND